MELVPLPVVDEPEPDPVPDVDEDEVDPLPDEEDVEEEEVEVAGTLGL